MKRYLNVNTLCVIILIHAWEFWKNFPVIYKKGVLPI